MTIFEHFAHAKNTKEELDAFYKMLGVTKKTFKKETKTNPQFAKIAELLKWNKEIEKLEEGKESGHTLRVAHLSKLVAEELKLDEEQVRTIYLASLFHDVGKHLIPASIIGKPGPLTDDEFKIIKTHAELAEGLLKGVVSDEVIDIVKNHHERMDGSGYPQGIVPEHIGARILGVVDSYDAMTSNRVYSSSKTKEISFQELERCTVPRNKGGFGYLYDSKVVETLIKIESPVMQ